MSKYEILSGNTDCKAEDVNYNPDTIGRLDAFFMDLIEKNRVQGASYLLSRYGKVFAHKSMGRLKTADTKTTLLPDSIRWIASITKLFTAAGIMKLVEDGKIYLYKNVSAFIEEFDTPQHNKISIEHLLTHTGGSVKPDPGAMAEAYPWPFLPFQRVETEEQKHECFRYFLTGPGYNEPGREWAYSTAGYMILAEIIARASGETYFDFIRKNFLGPLGMDRSFYAVPEELFRETCIVDGEYGVDPVQPVPGFLQFVRGGGGLFSTLPDLWKFAQMFMNKGVFNGKRFFGEHTVKAMTFNRLKNVPGVCWGQNYPNITCGLGFAFDNKGLQSRESYGHEGAGRSRFLVDPKEELIAIFFVPSSIEWLPESIYNPPQIIWSGLE
ncbi:MAG: beta-lactamase family protein [Spirochaetales bacterium]|nr:beta-lactamase family protein [Spirochaetales bacterium]